MPRLDFFANYKLFLRVALGKDTLLIGRGADCDVQLPDMKVSRAHARITVDDDGEYWIENFSANGTRVNASMIKEKTNLSQGDRVYIGDYVMIYSPEEAPPTRDPFEETVTVDWLKDRKPEE